MNNEESPQHPDLEAPLPEKYGRDLYECYRKSIALTKLLRVERLTTKTILSIESFCNELHIFNERYPIQSVAQLGFYSSSLGYFQNLSYNTLLIASIITNRNHWNSTTAQQFIAGVFSWLVVHKAHIENVYEDKEVADVKHQQQLKHNVKFALDKLNRQVWNDTFSSITKLPLNAPSQLFTCLQDNGKLSQAFAIAVYLGLKVTRNQKSKPLAFADALKNVAHLLPSSGLSLLEPLLEFPGVIPPGSLLKSSSQGVILVLSQEKEGILARRYDEHSKNYQSKISVIDKLGSVQFFPPSKIRDPKKLQEWWDQEWMEKLEEIGSNSTKKLNQHSFRLDRPPQSLVDIIDHLNKHDIDINSLCSLIESEPSFVSHLQESASLTSREKMQVKDVKHGLLMHGFERTKYVLAQHALLSRLSQHYFPLQDSFYQMIKLWAQITCAASEYHSKLFAEELNNWVYFIASGLFTIAELKTKTHWQYSGDCSHNFTNIIDSHSPELLISHPTKLAGAWSQERGLLRILNEFQQELSGKKSKDLNYAAISVGFILTMRIYLIGDLTECENDKILQQNMQLIGIEPQELPKLIEISLQNSHCYSPIHLNKQQFQ